MAMSYGNVYVARVAMGANDMQTVKAFLEAEAYDGPSLIIAYSHCIAHGYDMAHGLDQQKAAVQLRLLAAVPLQSRAGRAGQEPVPARFASRRASPLKDYIYNETRYTMLAKSNPEEAKRLLDLAEEDVTARWKLYEHMAHMPVNGAKEVKQ